MVARGCERAVRLRGQATRPGNSKTLLPPGVAYLPGPWDGRGRQEERSLRSWGLRELAPCVRVGSLLGGQVSVERDDR